MNDIARLIAETIDGYEEKKISKIERKAVKCVAVIEGKILMLQSKYGDYKFPGGGVKPGESHEQAIHRELLEECGIDYSGNISPVGRVLEANPASDEGIDVFEMESFYYLCDVKASDQSREQNLDSYEEELAIKPIWVALNDAIEANVAVMKGNTAPPWVQRETLVLQYLLNSEN